jgi:putative transposase
MRRKSWAAGDRKAQSIIDVLRAARMNKAADLVEQSVDERLTYYAFPDIHWPLLTPSRELPLAQQVRYRGALLFKLVHTKRQALST